MIFQQNDHSYALRAICIGARNLVGIAAPEMFTLPPLCTPSRPLAPVPNVYLPPPSPLPLSIEPYPSHMPQTPPPLPSAMRRKDIKHAKQMQCGFC